VNTTASPIRFLEEVATDFGATLDPSSSPAVARVPVIRASGRRHEFVLHVSPTGSAAHAREAPPEQLPRFCPDRHINGDHTFCLGWGPTSPSTVVDPASARAWWSAVVRFLRLQVTANETRRWMNGSSDWAHGDAAQHQARAEAAAEALGPRFRGDLQRGAFSVVREPHTRGARIALRRDGAHVARIVLGPPARLKDGDVTCPCEALGNQAVTECGDHVDHLTTFIAELWNWKDREAKFARDLARTGARCCGTLDHCTLRIAIADVDSQKKKKELHARRHRPRRRPRL
jgi:sirohydrochlorin ferrochelatase